MNVSVREEEAFNDDTPCIEKALMIRGEVNIHEFDSNDCRNVDFKVKTIVA